MRKTNIINKDEAHCAHCQSVTSEPYCENCGQRRQARFTLNHILGELLAILNYDKGFLHNFYYLTFRPVQSIRAYLRGKTKSFYAPLPYFLTAITLLLLLLVFGANYTGKHFASKVGYLFDVEETTKEIDDAKTGYYKQRKQDEKTILPLIKYIDSLANEYQDDKIRPFGDTLRTRVRQLIAQSKLQQKKLAVLDQKADKEELSKLKYAVFYLMPFFFALLGLFFYQKNKLFFTEHLIIHLYTISQAVWFVNLSLGLVLLFSWIYKLFTRASELPEMLSLFCLALVGIATVFGIAFWAYIQLKCSRYDLAQSTEGQCANCAYEIHTNYCAQCGQRRQERFTLAYIGEEILAVLNYDKGLFKNFVHLALHPSNTIIAYLNGKTKSYYPPLSYFLTAMTVGIIVFTFFIASTEGDFSVQDDTEEISKKQIEANYAKDRNIIEGKLALADSFRAKKYEENPSLLSKYVSLSDTSSVEDFSYTYTVTRLVEHNDDELRVLNKSGTERQIAIYSIFYGTPIYLTLLVFLLYFTKKLYLTEHLIIQFFLCAQGVWYAIVLLGVFIGIDNLLLPLFIANYNFTALPTSARLILIGGYLALLLGWYYYASIRCYKQSWWLVLLKCLFMLIAVATFSILVSTLGLKLAGVR